MAKAQKRVAEAWTYVLIADQLLPLTEQSRFVLKPLTHAERAVVRDALSSTQTHVDGSQLHVKHYRHEALKLATTNIVAIHNFPAGAAQPWPSMREDRLQYLEQLDDDAVLEIGNEIYARSWLGPDEVPLKNSSPPAATSGSGEPSSAATAAVTTG